MENTFYRQQRAVFPIPMLSMFFFLTLWWLMSLRFGARKMLSFGNEMMWRHRARDFDAVIEYYIKPKSVIRPFNV